MKKIKIFIPTLASTAGLLAGGTLMGFTKAAVSSAENDVTVTWGVFEEETGTIDDTSVEPIAEGTMWKDVTPKQLPKTAAEKGYYFSGWTLTDPTDPDAKPQHIASDYVVKSGDKIYAVFSLIIDFYISPSLTMQPNSSHEVGVIWQGAAYLIEDEDCVWTTNPTELPPGVTLNSPTGSKQSIEIVADSSITTEINFDLILTVTHGFNQVQKHCSVTIRPQVINVTSVRIIGHEETGKLLMKVDETLPLPECEVLPEAATNKDVTWESSDIDVFDIVGTNIVAKTAGRAKLTVKSVSNPNVTDNIMVVVETEPKVAPADIQFSELAPKELMANADAIDYSQFINWTWPDPEPSESLKDKRLIWKSNDPTQIVVTNDGLVQCIYRAPGEDPKPVTITAYSAGDTSKQTEINIKPQSDGFDTINFIYQGATSKDIFESTPTVKRNSKAKQEFEIQWKLLNSIAIDRVEITQHEGKDALAYVSGDDITPTGFVLPRDQWLSIELQEATDLDVIIYPQSVQKINITCEEGVDNAEIGPGELSGPIVITSLLLPGYDNLSAAHCKVIVDEEPIEDVIAVEGNTLYITRDDVIKNAETIDVILSASTEQPIYENVEIIDDSEKAIGRIRSRTLEDDLIIDVIMQPAYTLSLDKTTGTKVVIGEKTYGSDDFEYTEEGNKAPTLRIPHDILGTSSSTTSIKITLVSEVRQINSSVKLETDFGFDKDKPYDILYDKADADFKIKFTLAEGYKLSELTHLTYVMLSTPEGPSPIACSIDPVSSIITVAEDDLQDMLEQYRGQEFGQCSLQIHAGAELIE